MQEDKSGENEMKIKNNLFYCKQRRVRNEIRMIRLVYLIHFLC